MKKLFLISIIFLGFTYVSEAQNRHLEMGWVKDQLSDPEFEKKNIIRELGSYNFSSVWTRKQDYILGFIGRNYQRLHMRFTSIKKDPDNPLQYKVKGKSKVKSNICDFSGVMTIEQARKYSAKALKEQSHYFEKELQNAVKQRGIVVLKCVFDEDPNQKHPGRFEGSLITAFWIDHGDAVLRDELADETNFKNNQFIGTWTSHNKKLRKPTHWGEYRIPFAYELDQGSSEFYPTEKYLENGWEDLAKPGHAWWLNQWYK